MQFVARALSPSNELINLRLDAQDAADAERQLTARGMHATSIVSNDSGAKRQGGTGKGRAFSLVLLSQELLALLNAGLSLVECLEALQEKENNAASHATLARLLAGLRDGKRFSSVLAENPVLFPPLFVGIVRAAENTSDLPQALSRYIAFQQRVDRVRDKLIGAAIYPLILAGVGATVCLFLVGYVVPRFAEVYEGAGRQMPWLSQMMVNCGRFVTAHSIPLGILLILGACGAWTVLRTKTARVRLAALAERIPGVGQRLRIVRLSRMYFTLGMLLEGGISIVAAINTVQHGTGADMGNRLLQARAMIESGLPVSTAFEAHGLATPIALRLLRVGERSGDLGNMLSQSASFYENEVARWIDRFMRSFEPLLMTAIGLVVGVIVVLLYMPIFDLAGGLT